VGIERFDGTVHGRKGGFVLQMKRAARTACRMTWKIVETSGTEELAGSAAGQIIIGPGGEHSYTLGYGL
jgi:hypothetical protein